MNIDDVEVLVFEIVLIDMEIVEELFVADVMERVEWVFQLAPYAFLCCFQRQSFL